MRGQRIGVDLDSKNRFQMLKTYLNGRRFGETEVWETRNGFHVKIKKTVTAQKNILVRHTLGDDPLRLQCDEAKVELGLHNLVDTLFTEKWYPDGTYSKAEQINPLAEQFWGVNSLVY